MEPQLGPRTLLRLHRWWPAGFVWALLPLAVCLAQSPKPRWKAAPTQPSGLLPKEAIERHFESLQPRPRPQQGGATPGARLLSLHRQRDARLQARMRATQTAALTPSAASTVQPGIALRPALDAGEIPTSVVT